MLIPPVQTCGDGLYRDYGTYQQRGKRGTVTQDVCTFQDVSSRLFLPPIVQSWYNIAGFRVEDVGRVFENEGQVP